MFFTLPPPGNNHTFYLEITERKWSPQPHLAIKWGTWRQGWVFRTHALLWGQTWGRS